MAYLRTWGDIQAWMQDNSIVRWNISRTQDKADNNNVFVFDKDKSADENKLICERALDRFAGDVLYLVGWRTAESRTGGFSATVLYDKTGAQADPSAARVSGFGLYGIDGEFDRNGLINDLTNRIRNEYDRAEIQRLQKQLDEERKLLRDEQREFEREKVGAIGVIVKQIAPYLPLFDKHKTTSLVAGIDSETDVEAARIKVEKPISETPEPKGGEQQQQQEEASPFTEAEEDELYELLSRFKAAEPDYLKIIRSVVELAESKSGMYVSAKEYLLK